MTKPIKTRKFIAAALSAILTASIALPATMASAHDRRNISAHYGHGTQLTKNGHRKFHKRFGGGYHGTKAYRQQAARHGYHSQGHHIGHRKHHKKSDKGDLIAAGIIGLAIGAVIAGSANNSKNHSSQRAPYQGNPNGYGTPPAYQQQPGYGGHYQSGSSYGAGGSRYDEPHVITYDDPAGFQPWSREWFEWCDANYRSFDPNRGTYRGFDGRDHFCVPR